MRHTHTLVQMTVPRYVYELIKEKLLEAGYDHAVMDHRDDNMLSMHGIGLVAEAEPAEKVGIGELFDQYEEEIAKSSKVDAFDPMKHRDIDRLSSVSDHVDTGPVIPKHVWWDEAAGVFRLIDGCVIGGHEQPTSFYEKWKAFKASFKQWPGYIVSE